MNSLNVIYTFSGECVEVLCQVGYDGALVGLPRWLGYEFRGYYIPNLGNIRDIRCFEELGDVKFFLGDIES